LQLLGLAVPSEAAPAEQEKFNMLLITPSPYPYTWFYFCWDDCQDWYGWCCQIGAE
jgi:hypothetical protein